jgi:predicted  nucleic acid-binding Zn-ribbon protein
MMTAQEEIAQNNARIAELKQKLATLEGSTTGNALDLRLAANRARIGDMGNAQQHLGRIETRNQWEQTKLAAEKQRIANRISDAEYQYAQLDSAVRTAMTELAYADPSNTRAIKQLKDNLRAAEEKRDAFVKKNPFLGSRVTTTVTRAPEDDNSPEYTIEGEKSLYDSMTYQGKDGKTYWKDDADPEKYWDYRERVNAGENEGWRTQGRTARATQTMRQNVTDNTADNLGKYLKSIDNLRNGKFTSNDAKDKAKEMWDALDEQQKRDNPELKKLIYDTPSREEYAAWEKKAKQAGKSGYDALPGEKRRLADVDGKFETNGKKFERKETSNGEVYWIQTNYKRTW